MFSGGFWYKTYRQLNYIVLSGKHKSTQADLIQNYFLYKGRRTEIKSLKLNPHRWEHVKKTFLLLEQKQYYKKARFGFCQGREVNKYVNKVYKTYQAYKHCHSCLC